MKRVEVFVNGVAIIIVLGVFLSISCCSLFFVAQYDFADFPYFDGNSIGGILCIIIMFLFQNILMYFSKIFNGKIYIAIGIFLSVSLLFIFLVPLEPFSDMKVIYDIAIADMKDDLGYFQVYNNQIPITIYLYLLVSILGKNIIVPKVMNIFWSCCILVFLYKIYNLFMVDKERDSGVVWFAIGNIPVIIYINHIYNDVLYTALAVVMLYLVLDANYTKPRLFFLVLIAIVQYLIRPVGIIYIIAMAMYMVLFQNKYKQCIICLFCIGIGIFSVSKINEKIFDVNTETVYPVWSYIQMGINEEEFGFQDGTHSPEWTFEDCVEKYDKLGLPKVIKIYAKKAAWIWMEGTYQAERYGFGDSNSAYTYENRVTEEIRNVEESQIRKLLNGLMKGQYYLYIVLALIGVWSVRDRKDISMLFYVICGFVCFYLIWEIKSRYIYSLYPIFMFFSYIGWNVLMRSVKQFRGKKVPKSLSIKST